MASMNELDLLCQHLRSVGGFCEPGLYCMPMHEPLICWHK